MLDRSTSPPTSMFRVPRTSSRAETFVDLVTIELSGHNGCGASFDCEVEFTREPIVAARTYGEPSDCFPEEGGEVEITTVRPYKCNIVPATGRRGTTREYLPCPKWLEELLTDCIDPVSLKGE